MKFLLDANMPRSSLEVMRGMGHAANHVRDLGLGDASDDQIAAAALQTGSTLVSRDLDFADVRRFPPVQTQGFLILRLPDEIRASEITAVLAQFLKTSLAKHMPGHLVILEADRVRFRPPLST